MEFSKMTNTSPKTFVVLGSKRGGTSFVAQALGSAGVKFDVCGNGHNEDLDFVQLNDKILKFAGGDWNNIPSDEKIAHAVDHYKHQVKTLLKRKKIQMWGWKDPRQSATIKHFLPYLEDDVYLVCVFRKKELVAQSIKTIWGKPLAKGRKIVDSYYERLIDAIKEFTK